MIYMRTGLPGASKSLNTIADITKSLDGSRPVYYNNIAVLLFDFEVCESFQGFFYGCWLDNNKHKPSVKKKVLAIHAEDRQVEITDFPYLQGEYENYHDPFELWFKWIRKLYPQKLLTKIDETCAYLDEHKIKYEYMHFKALNLNWTKFDNPFEWYKLPRQSIIVIDECQQFFKKRKAGAEVPQWAAEFQTHRHKGWDIHLISQKAEYVDYYVRTLVGKHINYHNPFGKNRVGKMEKAQLFNPSDYHDRQTTQQSTFKRPTNFYGVYFSAEIHTHNQKLPKQLIMLPILLIAVILLFYFFYTKFVSPSKEIRGQENTTEQVETPTKDKKEKPETNAENLDAEQTKAMKYMDQYKPVIETLPYSAPVYQSLATPTEIPQLMCIATASRCSCFTQQSTRFPISTNSCLFIAQNGYFNPAPAGSDGGRRGNSEQRPFGQQNRTTN